jgi:cytochrome P450
MEDLAKRDYFTDHSVLTDPYAYFEAIRAHGPVHRLDNGIVMVTGFEEGLEVLRNTRDFSSVIASQGPAAPLPFAPQGSDITQQIEAHRAQMPTGELIATYDDDRHAMSRALLSHLFTPSRLKENEAFIAAYSDELVRSAVARGGCELINEIATPFVTLVIADLLGVPADDRQAFMDILATGPQPGSLDKDELAEQGSQLVALGMHFAGYVVDRRQNPREDVLSELANAKFPDGTTPDIEEIVKLATFLFAAGQDTSAKLLGNAMRFIIDEPGLQERVRAEPALIAALLEEVLRLDGPIKMGARLARRDTRIGDVSLPAGTRVMVALPAANRDGRRWQDPEALVLDRPRIKEHLAFSRGAHVCIGAPLARTEVRIILEKFIAYTAHIDLDREKHPRGGRDLTYEPSFIIRGLSDMHLVLTPAPDFDAD